jgi:hypothetical protein
VHSDKNGFLKIIAGSLKIISGFLKIAAGFLKVILSVLKIIVRRPFLVHNLLEANAGWLWMVRRSYLMISTHHLFAAYLPTTADGRYHWALNLLEYVGRRLRFVARSR